MKTIMLCLNQLGIGGIETAVLSQTSQLIKKGYKVVVVAKNGIYKEQFEKVGATCIDFEFIIQNEVDTTKIQHICDIIKKYNIEQVNIHQIDCISVVFPACVFCKVPYVAYIHSEIKGTYDWFEKNYLSYNIMFNLYFELAQKIITITEAVKEENKTKYNIQDNKYLVMKNSIDFDNFNGKKNPEKIEKILLISRLCTEKLDSIKNAIAMFRIYNEKHPNSVLTIAGDGEKRKEVEEWIEDIKKSVIMLGQINNVAEIMAENDMVIGMGRCILEAVAMKKIALISSYNGIKCILTPDIIEKVANTNFAAIDFETIEERKIVDLVEKLNQDDIDKIVKENYDYAYKNLNSNDSIYIIKESKMKNCSKEFIESIIELQNLYVKTNEQLHENYRKNEDTKQWLINQSKIREQELESRINKLKEKNNELNSKLEKIYNSRFYKIYHKLFK